MKTAAIETATVATNDESARSRVLDFAELVKARLTLLVLLTTAVGFYLGADNPINYAALFHAVLGTAAAAAGAAVAGASSVAGGGSAPPPFSGRSTIILRPDWRSVTAPVFDTFSMKSRNVEEP